MVPEAHVPLLFWKKSVFPVIMTISLFALFVNTSSQSKIKASRLLYVEICV